MNIPIRILFLGTCLDGVHVRFSRDWERPVIPSIGSLYAMTSGSAMEGLRHFRVETITWMDPGSQSAVSKGLRYQVGHDVEIGIVETRVDKA